MYKFDPNSTKNNLHAGHAFNNHYDGSILSVFDNTELVNLKENNHVNEKQFNVDKPLKLSIIGLGYVGAVSCACFASLGHAVIGVDADVKKVASISAGKSPIVEKDLASLLSAGVDEGRILATDDLESAVLASNVTLISVGTPSLDDGSCNLQFLKRATKQLAQAIAKKDSYHVIIFRSTVPAKTTNDVLIPTLEKYSNKISGKDFGVCFNPEFLRESCAISDFYHPPITVIGSIDNRSAEVAKKIYKGVEGDFAMTSIEVAEFVKYIDNTWHALKVSFGNEVGRICKAMDVDSHEVMDIFLQDTKLNISPYYLKPGFAFGGSCLPKDTRGIVHMAKQLNVEIPIISHINQSNNCHIEHTHKMIDQLDVQKVSIIGITFKAGTDDLRESPSIELMKRLLACGYQVEFYDPCILEDRILDLDPIINAQLNKCRCMSLVDMIDKNEAIVITQDKKYTEQVARMSGAKKHIIDVVHLSEQSRLKENYHGICW